MTDPGRYDGKPMLRLLDAYVLDALAALDPATEASMVQQAPRLAQALGVQADTWQGVVEAAMEMPPSSRDELRALWEQQVHAEIDAGRTPDVLAFAHAIVDARFGGPDPDGAGDDAGAPAGPGSSGPEGDATRP